MRGTPFIKSVGSCIVEKIKFVVLPMGIIGSILILLTFQLEEPLTAQDKTKEELTRKRVPDDLTDHFILPSFVNECFDKSSWLDEEIEIPIVPLHNPYFVRGDFDGNGNIDYAVIVESRKNGKEGLLVCFRNKETKTILLGLNAKTPTPFWSLMNWDAETPAEVSKIRDSKGMPIGLRPKGDSIVMKWEDAIGIIYWNGKMFRWKEVILNEGN